VVALADEGYRSLGLSSYRLLLTSLGDATCRPAYRDRLQEFLRGLDLDDETRARAELNPLRVLDDKRPQVQAQLVDAPLVVDHLCPACKEHYDDVRRHLTALGVTWEEAPRLVRGLDYYTRTTFEFVHDGLGAQSGIGGGGRYDGLMGLLGGQQLSGIGFGLGTDRTLLACQAEGLSVGDASRCDVFLVPLGAAAKDRLVELSGRLRRGGVRTDLAFGDRGLKGAMKGADRSGAAYVVVLGDRDLDAGSGAQLKDLRTGEQSAVPLDDLVDTVTSALKGKHS
jgi:histidyl-tRNA synthetase